MKKFFYLIIIINLFSYQSVLSLSQQTERMLYAGCYDEAIKKNSVDLSANYCNCFVNNVSKNNVDDKKFLSDINDPVKRKKMLYESTTPCLRKFPTYNKVN